MKRRALGKLAADYGQIVLGITLFAAGYRMFLIPNEIAPGGFTGIGQLVHRLTGLPVGAVTIALNAPLFLLSARSLGARFLIRSALTVAAVSLMIDTLPFAPIIPEGSAERYMPAAIFGGVLAGAGIGLVIRGNSTTGGSDLLAKLVSERFSALSVGSAMFIVDGLVIFASGFVFDALSALFGLIAAFIMGFVTDYAVSGVNTAHAYFIISERSERVADAVIERLSRSATILYGRGAFEMREREVLLCVVSRMETVQLRAIVAGIDPSAFVIATRAQEVLGLGFAPHKRAAGGGKGRGRKRYAAGGKHRASGQRVGKRGGRTDSNTIRT